MRRRHRGIQVRYSACSCSHCIARRLQQWTPETEMCGAKTNTHHETTVATQVASGIATCTLFAATALTAQCTRSHKHTSHKSSKETHCLLQFRQCNLGQLRMRAAGRGLPSPEPQPEDLGIRRQQKSCCAACAGWCDSCVRVLVLTP